jgi:hypothetical protein
MLPPLDAPRHSELVAAFLTSPDRAAADGISAAARRQAWDEVNTGADDRDQSAACRALLEKHESVSAEDFAKAPRCNCFVVLLSQTSHTQFHRRQIRLGVRAG